MSRKLEFLEDKFILQLTGLTSVAALRRHVEISYVKIKGVSTGVFHLPALTAKIGTSGFTQNLKEGMFDDGGAGWMFLSYKNHEKVVIVDLINHEFSRLVFETENPEEMCSLILSHVNQ